MMRAAMAHAHHGSAQGNAAEAVFHATAAAGLALDLGDQEIYAEAQTLLTDQLFRLARFAEALRHGHLAQNAWQRLGRPERECGVLVAMACALSEIDLHERALALARLSFDLAHDKALHGPLLKALSLVGVFHGRMGDWEAGEDLLMQALSRARDNGDHNTVSVALNALMSVLADMHQHHQQQGRADEAQAAAARLLKIARQTMAQCAEESRAFQRAILRSNAAAALLACGHLQDALALLRGSIQIAQQHGFRAVELRARLRLVQGLIDTADLAAAQTELDVCHALLACDPNAQAQMDTMAPSVRLAELRGDAAAAGLHRNALAAAVAQRQARAKALQAQLADDADGVMARLVQADGWGL